LRKAQSDQPIEQGGGIAARTGSTLILENVRLSNNTVECASESACQYPQGGAIYSDNADLFLNNVELDGNKAYDGSAIFYWDGTPHPNVYWHQFSIRNSAIHHNTAVFHTLDFTGRLFLTNSTLRDNLNTDPDQAFPKEILGWGETWIQNSTIIVEGKKGLLGDGNYIYIRNSLLLNISGTPDGNVICRPSSGATITSKGGNIFSDNSCSPGTNNYDLILPYDQVKLGALVNNGGRTPTVALLSGSPAIDRLSVPCKASALGSGGGIEELPLLFDQRGVPRNDGKCDAGAYEEAVRLLFLPLISK